MTADCDFDHGDCEGFMPSQADFEKWMASLGTTGPLYCDKILAAGSGSGTGSAAGSYMPVGVDGMAAGGGTGGGETVGGGGRRLLENSGDGPGTCVEGSTAVACVLEGMTEEECKMADDNGDGLTAYEAFGLYYMKVEAKKLLPSAAKNVIVAMAMFSYLDAPFGTKGEIGDMPDGKPITLMNVASFLDGMDHLFAGGTDELDWPEFADKKNVDFFFGAYDDDTDPDTLTLPEAYARGIAGGANDLFGWFDINDDGYVTKDEAMSVYDTVVEDGQKGRFVCDGLEVIDATSGKIDVRAPMGVDSHYACGWLVLPSWYYAKLPGADQHLHEATEKMEKGGGDEAMKYRRKLPRVAMASMRSKAGKQAAHEHNSPTVLKAAARKLLQQGSGEGSGSGSEGESAPYLASIQYGGEHKCTGVLVHEYIVLTTASCMREAGEGALVYIQGEDTFMPHTVESAHVHPSAMFDIHNDVAVLKLVEPCSAETAKLYDGGDLGISDCKRMMLKYSSWNLVDEGSVSGNGSVPADLSKAKRRLLSDSGGGSAGPVSPGVTVSDARLVDHKDCAASYKMHTGSAFSDESIVTRSEICVTALDGEVHNDMGMPLIAKVKGVDGHVLLGLGVLDEHPDMPAIFTRVSSSLQWIYAIAPQLSSYPSQFDIDITVEQIGLPHNATLMVHHMAAEGGEESLMMDGILDSKCMTPWSGTASGAMLLILDMPPGGSHGCHEECIQTMGFTAKFGLRECESCTDQCETSVTWDKMGPMFEDKGKGYTGGLGKRMVKRVDREYGVWACMRDWSPAEQIACGARNKELACFWFEEKSRHFEFKGLNDKTRLVTPAQHKHGLDVEDSMLRGRTLATSPDQAHV